MKKVLGVLIIAMAILAFAPSASAQGVTGYVEYQHLHSAGANMPQADAYIHGPAGKWSWSAWLLTCDGWGEAYAGPTWAPTGWLEVSASVGMEQSDPRTRYAGSVWMGKGKWSLLSICEDGGSGHWYKHTLTYAVTDRVAVGAFSQRFVGNGPYVEVKVGKFLVWGTATRYQNQGQGLVGLRYNF